MDLIMKHRGPDSPSTVRMRRFLYGGLALASAALVVDVVGLINTVR